MDPAVGRVAVLSQIQAQAVKPQASVELAAEKGNVNLRYPEGELILATRICPVTTTSLPTLV